MSSQFRFARRQFLQRSSALTLGLLSCARTGLASTDYPRADQLAFINRLSWGVNAKTLADVERQGQAAWLEAQMHPKGEGTLPAAIERQIAAMTINKVPMSLLWYQLSEKLKSVQKSAGSPEQKAQEQQNIQKQFAAISREAAAQQMLYAIYSPNQLQEQLAWFWMNHFSVFQEGPLRVMMGDYYRRVIKPHVLGRFVDLFRATVYSPQMLLYLNNAQNAKGHINENYGREIMELHTVGVGSGYTQADVTNLARVLTGLGVAIPGQPIRVPPQFEDAFWQDGLVVFNPARHDSDPKTVFGHVFHGKGLDEINQVIEFLGNHPATARHISTQLAQFFVAENPPKELIDRMVDTWQKSHGEIASVLRTLFYHREFTHSLGKLFKDPLHYLISAARLLPDEVVINHTDPLVNWSNLMGEALYGRSTPDGYQLGASHWNGSGQMANRFEFAGFIAARPGALVQPPPKVLIDMNSPFIQELLGSFSTQTRKIIEQAKNSRQTVSLLLSAPEFMWR
ncbi:DUF1800 domain-containing protein [Halothiobacillus sp.]|uniref:DUF1800 domain-containing protein n=1 Tax=Halothiobacillus sp. TaxID=1891311 RepID=UPI002618442F|nr:DUF1800 domain-containing protein [Halothiobacillus sp.]